METGTSAGVSPAVILDIAALASALLWPLVLVVVLLLFRDRLVEVVKMLAPRVNALSVGPLSLEFAEARVLSLQMSGRVDIRHAGQSADINDSTLEGFYKQIRESSRLDYAIVDLGDGREWLTSRLFIISVILARMRGLDALVFVETAGHVRRKFVGVSECGKVRWRLAMQFPWLEAALAHAQAGVWPAPAAVPFGSCHRYPVPGVSDDHGRLEWPGNSPEAAAQLMRIFLDGVQANAAVPPLDEWETLPSAHPTRVEHARWLKACDLEQIMGHALSRSSVRLNELHRSDEVTKERLFISQTNRWIALTHDDGVFERLVDRLNIIETAARNCVQVGV